VNPEGDALSATALTEPPPPLRRPPEYPFHIGYRPVIGVDADGTPTYTEVPLTEEDFLHPQEGDRFMLVDAHQLALVYLVHALRLGCRHLPAVRVFTDHRIEWQVPGVLPHGPDAVLFDRFTAAWDSHEGTLRVRDTGADVLAVFEVTSESTRHIDFGQKFAEFARAGVPYYLIVDVAEPNGNADVLGFRLVNGSYRPMRRDPALGYFLPRVGLSLRWADDRLIVADEDGRDIPDSREAGLELDALAAEALAEKERADAEKVRADAEKQRADAEKARAEELARELAELKARLASNG
jgi:colicin import membrane protein